MLPNVCSSNHRDRWESDGTWALRLDSQKFLLLAYFGTELGIWQCVPTTLWIMKASTCQNYATIFGCVKQLAGMLLYLLWWNPIQPLPWCHQLCNEQIRFFSLPLALKSPRTLPECVQTHSNWTSCKHVRSSSVMTQSQQVQQLPFYLYCRHISSNCQHDQHGRSSHYVSLGKNMVAIQMLEAYCPSQAWCNTQGYPDLRRWNIRQPLAANLLISKHSEPGAGDKWQIPLCQKSDTRLVQRC